MTAEKKEVNHSALNAEKAYKLLDEIEYKDRTLYDIAFEVNTDDVFENLNAEQTKELYAIRKQMDNAKTPKQKEELESKIFEKFSGALTKPIVDLDFRIKKVLRMNSGKARELSELYTGKKTQDFMEVVENCVLYITFLKRM